MSNIAWDISEDKDVAHLLQSYNINAIDVAPGKYFPDPLNTTDKDVALVRQWWEGMGFEIIGMQALLFGTTGLNVFGCAETQSAMLKQLDAICRIGTGMGATRLVFGSPKNRDRSGLTDELAIDISINFFRRLGEIARSHGVLICLEPNPTCYGANFMTNSTQTARVVELVNHPSIQMQFDSGALAINSEDPADVLERFSHLIGHVHASEPNLLPLGDTGFQHSYVHSLLSRALPNHLVTIEMLATTNEAHLVSIERAIKYALNSYSQSQVETLQ